jgi:uncharacterized membrane protein
MLLTAILAVALVVAFVILYSRIRKLQQRVEYLERQRGVAVEPETEHHLVEAVEHPSPARPDLRHRLANREWEEIVGADWLNKAGVFILVIGIALGLAYSFTYMGPWGRVGTALAISAAMLISGIVIERQPGYATFGRGLLGGGWAGLYFTTYAIYGLAAAKVIDNPALESVLLGAVAAGMIAHALRYRSQTLTLLTYFIGFVTLGITPVTIFSVVALLPLAVSVLYLAWRYEWHRIALAGVIATYLVCASRGGLGASLATTQILIAAYWLVFEGFVLLRVASRQPFGPAERWIFPLNTIGAVALSLPKWQSAAPGSLWVFFAAAAVVHVCSSLVRLYLRTEAIPTERTVLDRALSGGWESAALAASLFAAIAVVLGCPQAWIAPALLVEGELLFLLSLRFRQEFLERLAMAAFGASIARIVVVDAPRAHHNVVFGRSILTWTPTAIAAAVLFYCNRALKHGGQAFVWASAGSILAAVAADVDYRYVGLIWLVFAGANIEAGLRWRLREFQLAGYVSGALACVYVFIVNVVLTSSTLVLFCASVICYLGSARLREAVRARPAASTAAAIFAAALIRALVPGVYVAAGWSALMVGLFWIGVHRNLREFRLQAMALAVGVLISSLTESLNHVWGTALAAAGLYSAQLIAPRGSDASLWLERHQRAWFSVLGTLVVAMFLSNELSGGLLTVGLGVQALALLAAGFPLADRVLRLSALALFFLCIGKLFVYDLRSLPTLDRIFSFIVLGAIMVGVSWVYTRFRKRIHRYF